MSIFNIRISNSPGNWKYFTSFRRNRTTQNSSFREAKFTFACVLSGQFTPLNDLKPLKHNKRRKRYSRLVFCAHTHTEILFRHCANTVLICFSHLLAPEQTNTHKIVKIQNRSCYTEIEKEIGCASLYWIRASCLKGRAA